MRVFCFGDSNAAGAELQPHEHPFVHWFAEKTNAAYTNYGREGSSLGLILHSLVMNQSEITKDDVVLFVVPPDSRWYDENEEQGFYTLMNYQRDDYFKFLNNKTLEWFRYHHALFIYTAQKILNDIGCYYLMTHTYGQVDEYEKYHLAIDYSKFLSELSITNLLSTNASVIWRSYPEVLPKTHQLNQDGPHFYDKESPYFKGTYGHPNELGHKRLADLMFEKYCNDRQI